MAKKEMTVAEAKKLARALIVDHLSIIGYGEKYERYIERLDEAGCNLPAADAILKCEMDRVAKLFGMKEAYFQ